MKISASFLLLGLCSTGLFSGVAARRFVIGRENSAAVRATFTAAGNVNPTPVVTADKPLAAKPSNLHSTDTLETLAALNKDSIYARLALWLIDATEEDIAGYWVNVMKKNGLKGEITSLVFIHWTRLNPEAAIAAAAGTNCEHYAWGSWGCHDPLAALAAAAIAADPKRLNQVADGIGEFHGDWLRAHFDQIPESARDSALVGLTKWDDTDQPARILEFLKEHGHGLSQQIFASLVRRDPWAAYEWIQKNSSSIANEYGSTEQPINLMVSIMADTRPDALQSLAEQAPSGATKRTMERTLFQNLLKSEPEAALEQAKSTQAPRIAVERLAAVGRSYAPTDPDRALEVTQMLFTLDPSVLERSTLLKYPDGNYISLPSVDDAYELVRELIKTSPAKVLAWLESADLSDKQKQALGKRLEVMRRQ